MADTRRPRPATGAGKVVEPTAISTAPELGVLKLSSEDEAPEVDMIPLFELDGKEFLVPRTPSPTVGLKWLKLLNTEGESVAAYFLLTKMLGEEGYDALMTYEQLTDEQYEFVLTAASRIATGKTERPKARSRQNGRPARRN